MKISAYDVGIPVGQESQYRFSMDPARVVAALKEVIAGIEAGKLLMQKATFETEAKQDEYVMSYVYLTFHEKQP